MRPGQNGEFEHFGWITNANGEFHIMRWHSRTFAMAVAH